MSTDRSQFTWKPCAIDNWNIISQELQVLPDKIWRSRAKFYPLWDLDPYRVLLPSLFTWFESVCLVSRVIAYVEVQGGSKISVHSDEMQDDPLGWDPVLALNLPIRDCLCSRTRIYHSSSPPRLVSGNSRPYIVYNPSDLSEIDSYILSEPILLNVKHPHGIENWGSETRHSLSIRFAQDPWWLVDN